MKKSLILETIDVNSLENIIKKAVQEVIESGTTSDPPATRYFSRQETAELLGISISSIDRLRESKKLVFSRIGNSLRISQEDLKKYIEKQKKRI